MKQGFILLALVFAGFGWHANAQCIGNYQHGSGTLSSTSEDLVQLSDCNWAGDYINLTIESQGNFRFTSSFAGDYFTLTDVSNNVISHGPNPFVATDLAAGAYRLHLHADSSCTTGSGCRVTTGRAILADSEIPANDSCENAVQLTCDSVVQGNTTLANLQALPTCSGTSFSTGPGLWYSIVGNGGIMSASTCNTADFDTKLAVYTDACGESISCVAFNDDFAGCDGFTSFVEWESEADVTYYIYVTGYGNSAGEFTLTMACEETSVECGDVSDIFAAVLGQTNAQVYWTAGENNTSFNVALMEGGTVLYDETGVMEANFTFENLTPNTTYTAMIAGVCGEQVGQYIPFEFTTLPVPVQECGDVSGIFAAVLGQTNAQVYWTAGENNTSFNVALLEGGTVLYDETGVEEANFTFENLTPNTTYTVMVAGVCGEQVGQYISYTFTTLADETEPGDCDFAYGDLSWEIVSPYRILFNVAGAQEGQLFEMSAGNVGYTPVNANFGMRDLQMPYLRTSLHQGRTYEFYIRPVGADGTTCDWVGPYQITMPTVGDMAQRATMYPNPARSIVNIEGVNAETVQIFNNAGAVVHTQKVMNNQFDVQSLPAGAYVIQITDADGTVSSQQIIKQ